MNICSFHNVLFHNVHSIWTMWQSYERNMWCLSVECPHKQKPLSNTIKVVIQTYKNYGFLKARIHRKKAIVGKENVEFAFLRYHFANLPVSFSLAEQKSAIFRKSLTRMKLYTVQALKATDFQKRMNFHEFIFEKFWWPKSLKNLTWSDEAELDKEHLIWATLVTLI